MTKGFGVLYCSALREDFFFKCPSTWEVCPPQTKLLDLTRDTIALTILEMLKNMDARPTSIEFAPHLSCM